MSNPANKYESAHMGRVAALGCILGRVLRERHPLPEIHHIREGQGMSERASHYLVIGLCPDCHRGPRGLHGDRSLFRIAKVDELDLLALTIAALQSPTAFMEALPIEED
jgi:hypothetical protein